MNQRDSTIELYSSFQPEIKQGKVSRKSDIDKIVFNQSHPNGQKNTCMKT